MHCGEKYYFLDAQYENTHVCTGVRRWVGLRVHGVLSVVKKWRMRQWQFGRANARKTSPKSIAIALENAVRPWVVCSLGCVGGRSAILGTTIKPGRILLCKIHTFARHPNLGPLVVGRFRGTCMVHSQDRSFADVKNSESFFNIIFFNFIFSNIRPEIRPARKPPWTDMSS